MMGINVLINTISITELSVLSSMIIFGDSDKLFLDFDFDALLDLCDFDRLFERCEGDWCDMLFVMFVERLCDSCEVESVAD